MDFEQKLRAAFAPCAPRSALRSSILVSAATATELHGRKGRTGSRTILVGAILVVAAAAGMLLWVVADKPEPQVAAEAPAPAAAPVVVPAVVASAAPVGIEQIQLPPEAAKPGVPEEVLPPPVKPFAVELLPLENGATDDAAKAAISSFYTAFVNGLRGVPGLSLTLRDSAEPSSDPLPDFQLTVRGSGPDPANRYTVSVSGDVKFMLEGKRKLTPEQRAQATGVSFASSTVIPVNPGCVAVATADPDCRTPTMAAGSMVDWLRKRTFPEDPSLRLQMQNDLLNASLDPVKRLKALTEVGTLRSSSGGGALQDPVIVRGAIALATTATDPAIRAQVWRAMRGSRNPDLVIPVTTSLLQERDPEVRMQAVVLLQEDFSSDPRAREALEVVARGESPPLVRALATRALKGEAAWKDYIVTSLKDSSLSDAERIEGLIYHVATPGRTPGSRTFSGQLNKSPDLLDDEAIQALGRILTAADKLQDIKPVLPSLLSEVGVLKKPAVTSMFLRILQQSADPATRYMTVSQLGRRLDDPGVREALQKVSREDADLQLREVAAKALGNPTVR